MIIDRQQMRRAGEEVKRLQEQIETIEQQLNAKQGELNRAEKDLTHLEEVLEKEREILRQLNEKVAALEEAVRQANAQLETDLERLKELTDYLHQQEQLELQMQKAYEDQLTATNQAQDRANEADRQEREAQLAADQAAREQAHAQAVVGRLEAELNDNQRLLACLLVALAAALLLLVGSAIVAGVLILQIAAVKAAIARWENQLVAARNKLWQATSKNCNRTVQEHEEAGTRKRSADDALVVAGQHLATCKTNWENQIVVKNAAKVAVDEQNAVVQTDLERLNSVGEQLATAREEQSQQATRVHQIEIQVKEKKNHIVQLKAEQEALQLRQTEIETALRNAQTLAKEAEQRHEQAKTTVKNLNIQLNAKIIQINETNGSIQRKQSELDAARADYILKEKAVYQIKNKLSLITKELQAAADRKHKLNEEIQIQQTSIAAKNQQHESLRVQRESLERESAVLEGQKTALEKEVEGFHRQLNEQRQAIIEKTNEVHTVSNELQKRTHEKEQIEIRYREQTVQAQQIRARIDEYGEDLRQNEADLKTLQTKNDIQVTAQQVRNSVDPIDIQFNSHFQ